MKKTLRSGPSKRSRLFGCLFLVTLTAAMGRDALPANMPRSALCLQANPNLIQNPGFEDSGPLLLTVTTSPWIGEEVGVTSILNDGNSHSGGQEAAFVVGSTANEGQLMQMFTVTPNTDYVASAWIGGTPGFTTVGEAATSLDTKGNATQRGFGIHIPSPPGTDPDGDGDTQGFDGSTVINYVTITNDSSGNYQFYTFTFNSGSNTTLFVDFDADLPANGILRIDDVSVTQVGGGGPPPPPPPANALPPPWRDGDIGSVGIAGQASYDSGSAAFTVSGSGADIGGTADGFNYVYQSLTGDGTLVAHVASMGNTSPGAQAGLMIRETFDPGSRFADMLVTAARGAQFQGRIQPNTSNFNAGGPNAGAPIWLRISRAGDVFAGSTSPDGQTWSDAGTATIPMAQTVFIGLAVVSQDNGALDTAVFDSVTLSGGASPPPPPPNPPPGAGSLPPPWQDGDIGSVGVSGSASYSGGTFTVIGSGTDIWGTADAFNFVYQPLSGDGTLIARVTGLGNSDPWAKAGVMIRESLDPASTDAAMFLTPGNGTTFQGRTTTGGSASSTSGPGASTPYWLMITRAGNSLVGLVSADGVNWTAVGSATIPMAQSVFIGLAVTSHNNGTTNTAMFDSVTGSGGWSYPSPSAGAAASSTVSHCGLLGIEFLAPLGLLWGVRTKSRRRKLIRRA